MAGGSFCRPASRLCEGEVADRGLLEKIFIEAREQGRPFDGVLHFAALIEAGESMVRPETFFRNNTASTLSLLEAMLAEGRSGWFFLRRRRCTASRKLFRFRKMRS